MWRILIIALLVFGLAACGSAPAPEDVAIARLPTEAAPQATVQPTVAPAPRSLADIDLEPLLIQSGDLPAGLTGAQVLDTPPPAYETLKVPKADKLIFQRLQRNGQPAGYIVVTVYESTAARDDAYTRVTDDVRKAAEHGGGKPQETNDAGEHAVIVKEAPPLSGAKTMFVRCRAVADILMTGDLVDEAAVLAYARRLDKRLQQAVC